MIFGKVEVKNEESAEKTLIFFESFHIIIVNKELFDSSALLL